MNRLVNDEEFLNRVAGIPRYGLGLSVDVYDPDIGELVRALGRAQLPIGYLEIFKAHPRMLQAVRTGLPAVPLEYHGEGVWMSQPDWPTAYPAQSMIEEAAVHLHTLGASWFNHECASKQMVGYSFGTYLPPLFSRESALVTARHARWVQAQLDRWFAGYRSVDCCRVPLLLLETPPLTYVGFGDIPYADFFRLLIHHSACGLVLDVGHLWTVFRYYNGESSNELSEFVDDFLDRFPIERVVQIHLAGLAVHPAVPTGATISCLPPWLDCHAAPVPEVLFEMLDRILTHPGLTNLRGIALEVDTKAIDIIVREYAHFRERYGWWENQTPGRHTSKQEGAAKVWSGQKPSLSAIRAGESRKDFSNAKELEELTEAYRWYAETMIGRTAESRAKWHARFNGQHEYLGLYVEHYKPYELLVWGGDLREMFPHTVSMLEARNIGVHDFVAFWFGAPRPILEPYDFFLLKVERFVEFVGRTFPGALPTALGEAENLKHGYAMANEEGGSLTLSGAG